MCGSKYFMTFIYDFSLKVWVYLLKHECEIVTKFKLWKVEVESRTGRKIKYLQPNNRTKYTNLNFKRVCEEHDIQIYFIVYKTPQKMVW